MKYLILGGGLQGPSVAYAIAKNSKHGDVFIAEKDKARFKRLKWQLDERFEFEKDQGIIALKVEEKQPVLDLFSADVDLTVISTLPYPMNFGIAKQCIDKGWHYYDLGGHVGTSETINLYASYSKKNSRVMTDIGLAPGIVNIMGQYAISKVPNCMSLMMFCGGLPVDPSINELNYGIVFSTEGLLNEYFNKCEIVRNSKIEEVEPMGNLQIILPRSDDKSKTLYEAFNTSGGAHTTLNYAIEKGLKTCAYQTLRYSGHAKVIRFLKHDVGMRNDEIAALIEDKIGRISEDKVLIKICATAENEAAFVVDNEIYSDDNFTAMQRSTGFSAAAIVLATEEASGVLKYEDVNVDKLLGFLKPILPEVTV